MAWWNPFKKTSVVAAEPLPIKVTTGKGMKTPFEIMSAGISNIVKDTEDMTQTTFNNTNEFDLYDDMLNFDPELNGAVRTISLTANKYRLVGGRNAQIRTAIKDLTEDVLDFDDFLINAMRNLMVYGNDINKLVGKSGVGITAIQSLPVSQVTIVDDRKIPFSATKEYAIYEPKFYLYKENAPNKAKYSVKEIMHIKIDYRSHWYMDRMGRWTYGVWGASRFSALKQAIRAKYNSMNNRIALEDSLTKQYITIGPEAIENIQDPDEAAERLENIMDSVGSLLDGLRSDQVPILPHYVNMEFVDLKNTVPDNSTFLDNVNADISAVLHVPRVSMGQERGSTFAATFNASQWSVQSIRRLQTILGQSIQRLFSKHLELLGIPHRKGDIPKLEFDPMDEESPFETTRRTVLAYEAGITTLNEARMELDLPRESAELGKQRYKAPTKTGMGEMPRQNENKPENLDGETNEE
jgi:hypothetical protein